VVYPSCGRTIEWINRGGLSSLLSYAYSKPTCCLSRFHISFFIPMITLQTFVGFDTKKQVVNWLNEFFHKKTEKTKPYCILHGTSGNGKTILPKLLAEEFDAELFYICPLDIQNNTDLNNIIKSLNTQSLTHRKKIIHVDDVDEFHYNYKSKLVETISIYPVIYTCNLIKGFSEDFGTNGLRVFMRKPITSEILKFLETISDLPIETLDNIARNSKSMRSAVLSTYTGELNELRHPTVSMKEFLWNVKKRDIDDVLNRGKISYIFKSIRGYDSDALKVMNRFADFDYRCRVKFEEIDSYIVNNMIEPIEKIDMDYESKKKYKKNIYQPEKKKSISAPTLEKYF